MGITDGKLLFCNGNSYKIKDNTISTNEYNDRTVYDCFNNSFLCDGGIPDLILPLITIDDSPRPNKRYPYNYDLLTATIYVTSGI